MGWELRMVLTLWESGEGGNWGGRLHKKREDTGDLKKLVGQDERWGELDGGKDEANLRFRPRTSRGRSWHLGENELLKTP